MASSQKSRSFRPTCGHIGFFMIILIFVWDIEQLLHSFFLASVYFPRLSELTSTLLQASSKTSLNWLFELSFKVCWHLNKGIEKIEWMYCIILVISVWTSKMVSSNSAALSFFNHLLLPLILVYFFQVPSSHRLI